MIYFDQAASSFPKPKSVVEAVTEALNEYAANPGRGGHALAARAANQIYKTRAKLANFFGITDPNQVIFFNNATGAINQAIKGFPFQEGDHIITTAYEHNSIRRPLEFMKDKLNLELTYLCPNINGELTDKQINDSIKENTKLIAITHGSNLTGAIFPIKKFGDIAKQKNITFLVDASQTAGILPINMTEMNIDMLALPGHKGLLGPQGTGVLILKNPLLLEPLFHGGTGSFSELITQPEKAPERYESGTLNTPGIVGLLAGIEEVEKIGLQTIYKHEHMLTSLLIDGLEKIEGVRIYGPDKSVDRLGVVTFLLEGIDSQEVAMILDEHYHIAVRAGLHCSPLGHESIGTKDLGTIRVSFGPYNSKEEVQQFIRAIEEIKIGYEV